ncbi:hypothetical protein SAMN06296952_1948 [Oscillospiraceae bacterium]|nr:hypothetical protein SAMN06296952_1948 [Oscillospiraceae bacterium]
MKKDSTGVVVGRVFITIILVITLGLASIGAALRATFFNTKSWRELLTSDDFIDILMEDADIEELTEDPILKDELDEDFFTDYAHFCVNELVDVIESGDTDIDEDALDDLYDEYLEDLFYEYATPAERAEFKDEFYDAVCDSVEEAADDLEESGFFEFKENFNKGFIVYMGITVVMSAVLIAVMLLISKDKFAAIRNTGIALTVCEALNGIGIAGIGGLLTLAFKEADEKDLGKLFSDFVAKQTGIALFILGALLALGIFLIIFSAISKKNAAMVSDESDGVIVEEG